MRYQNTQDLYDTYISFCKKKIHTITNHAFCSFSDKLLNKSTVCKSSKSRSANEWRSTLSISIDKRHILSSSYYYWRLARHRLSLQFQVMSKYLQYLLRRAQKRKNLALSLLTGLRKKRTKFLKRRRQNLVSCGEFHKEKKSNSGTISILCIKKGIQKARECYSR